MIWKGLDEVVLHIAPYTEEYHDRLVEIWLRAVSQTHDFLTEEDIRFYYEMMQNGALRAVEIWVCLNTEQEPIYGAGRGQNRNAVCGSPPSRLRHGNRS